MTVGKCIGSSSGLKICFQYIHQRYLQIIGLPWCPQNGLRNIIAPGDMCHKAEICFKLRFVLITFVMKWQIIFWFSLHWEGGEAMHQKKIGNMTKKTKAPTCGQLCRDDGKPAPTTGIPTPPFHLASCRHLRYMRMFRAPITTITNPPDKAD